MRKFKTSVLWRHVSVVLRLGILILLGLLLISCSSGATDPVAEEEAIPATESIEEAIQAAPEEEDTVLEEEGEQVIIEPSPFSIFIAAFNEGDPIPEKFSCDGENISPALEWNGVPDGTSSFVLIMDDPDAPGGTWIHWALFDIPGDVAGLEGSVPSEATLSDGSVHGANSWGRTDYGGPCPPSGTHRYFFKLYALDVTLGILEGSSVETILEAMNGHVLAEASLMGTYTR